MAGCSSRTASSSPSGPARSPSVRRRHRACPPRSRRRHAGPRQHPSPPGQTLTRARAQQADLFTPWLRELYPVWARRRGGGVRRRADGAGRARPLRLLDRLRPPLRLPARARRPRRGRGPGGAGAGRAHRRVAWIDRPRQLRRRPSARRPRRGARRDRRRHRAPPRGAPRAWPRLGCRSPSPVLAFSVTGRLMEESAALARRLDLPLHTHLAETVEEEEYCRSSRLHARRIPRPARLARGRRLVRALRPSVRGRGRTLRRDRHRRRALPDVQPPARCRGRSVRDLSTQGVASGSAWTAPRRTSGATFSPR